MLSNVILNYMLIPKYGIVGAGFATMFTEGLMCVLKTLRVKKIYPEYKVFTKERVKYVLVGVAITLLLLFIKNRIEIKNIVLNIFFIGFLYVLIYISLLIILKDKLIIDLLCKIKYFSKKIEKA